MKLLFTLSNGQSLEITNKQLLSTTFVDFTSNSDEIRIGTACSSELDVTIKNYNKEFSDYNFSNSQIDAFWEDGTKVGHFYVSNVDKTRSSWIIESEDILNRTDITWNGTTFPCSIYEILTSVCNQCNINLYNVKDDFENFDIVINTYENLEGRTCRDIIKLIAEVLGTYAIIDNNGQLCFKWYDMNNVKATIEYGKTTSFTTNEIDTKRDGILILNGSSNIQVGDTSCSFIIDNNPLLASCSDNELYVIANRIWENIKGTLFVAGEFELRTISGIRAGDTISVIEENGTKRIALVTSLNIESDVSATLTSFGDNSNVSDSKSTSTSGRDTTETYSTEVFFGRAKNNQRIHAKEGTYVVCEKLVKNVTKFTQVNMEISVLFEYTPNKLIYFSLYANDILLRKEIPFWCHEGLNYFSLAEVADTTGMEATDYLLKVRVANNCEVDIQPFDAIMSLKVKSGRIDDVQATDQYFSERVREFNSGVLTWKKLQMGKVSDYMELKVVQLQVINTWDISVNQDGSVIATLYDNGLLNIVGQHEDITQNEVRSNYRPWELPNPYRPWEKAHEYTEIIEIKTKNIYNLPNKLIVDGTIYPKLKKVTFSNDIQVISNNIINDQYNDREDFIVRFNNNIIGAKTIGYQAFANCDGFTANDLWFNYEGYENHEIIHEDGTIEVVSTKQGVVFDGNGHSGNCSAFKNCTGISGQVLINCTKEVTRETFMGCTEIDSIRIVDSETYLDNNIIKKRRITFGDNCCDGCSNLWRVRMDYFENGYSAGFSSYSIMVPQDYEWVYVSSGAFKGTLLRDVACPNRDEFTCAWSDANARPFYIGQDAFKDCFPTTNLLLNGTKIGGENKYNIIKGAISWQGFREMFGYVIV